MEDGKLSQSLSRTGYTMPRRSTYCIPGNFSDVKTLVNLGINSFSLRLQVANLVLRCILEQVSKFAQ